MVNVQAVTCRNCDGSGAVWVPDIPGDALCRSGSHVGCRRCGGLGEIRPTIVRTEFIGPTDTRGSRYRVTAEDGTRRVRTYPADYSVRDMHETAAGRFAADALGMMKPPTIEYADGRPLVRGFRFAVWPYND